MVVPPLVLAKYNQLLANIQKFDGKLDSIKYSMKRKQQELQQGLCTEEEYIKHLHMQKQLYYKLKEEQRKYLQEYLTFYQAQ